TGDAQQQARELLTGITSAHSAPQSPPRDGKVTSRTADAQESARQLLLGTTGSRVGAAEAIKQSEVARASGETARQARPVAHGDARELPQVRRSRGSPDARPCAGPRSLVGWLQRPDALAHRATGA